MDRHLDGRSIVMGRMVALRILVTALLSVLLLGASALAGEASAQEAPRWIVKAVTMPTHLETNAPRDEVQKLTVSATGGVYRIELHAKGWDDAETSESLPYNATAAEVQTVLGKVPGVNGPGNVSVSGGPGTATPTEYTITFENEQGDVPIDLMWVLAYKLEGTAVVGEVTRGALPEEMVLMATNVGGAATDGSKITLKDALPSWLTPTHVEGVDVYASFVYDTTFGAFLGGMSCAPAPAIECTYEGKVDPGDQLYVTVKMSAAAAPGGSVANTVAVAGGGADEASEGSSLAPDSTPVPSGPSPGTVFTALSNAQAGGHPNIVTSFWLNSKGPSKVAGTPKDVRFDLPAGLVGSTVGMPRCNMHRIINASFSGENCPDDTMVGVAEVVLATSENGTAEQFVVAAPVYNIAPSPGEPAAFAFNAIVLPVRLDTSVLSNGDYGVRVTAGDLTQAEPSIGSTVTIWGVPQEHSGPGSNGEYVLPSPHFLGGPNPNQSPIPLMTNPQQCQRPLTSMMSTDSWDEPGVFKWAEAPMGTLSNCLIVPFGTSFSLLPDTLEAGAPAGYHFELHVRQQNTAGTLATSSVREVSLKLPAGVVVNPSAAWGLKACSTSQFYGPNHPSQEPAQFAGCPREAKIGEVEVESPDLEHPLKGDVFLGTPECEVCSPSDAEGGRMVRLFVQLVGEGEAGIIVKLEGHALVDQATGQITTVFKETPQLPFSRMRFVLEGGPRAVLANPRMCGMTKATGDLAPWSDLLALGEQGVVSDSLPFYELEINQNCFGPQFDPSFVAGSTNIQAGAYTPFTLAFGRPDDSQFLSGLSQTMPAGLLGNIASVPLCGEPQAAEGECPEASLIGHVQALTGPGADPFLVSGGKVFLTGGYKGAPYGLSIVVPAVAGPYTLSGTTGKGTVVVRARIDVDPTDAHLTVVSDPLPTVLDGIPLQLKAVNVTIDRPGGFTFNPTSCAKMAIGATLSSSEGMSASKSSSFQVTNCASLGFKPSFSASTNGKTSRRDGASLNVRLSYPKAAFGSQANIRSVKVDLPRQLPSFLETLQHACPDSTFNQNPAACPAASRVGAATASTPILPVPLVGPAYFVSHGGAKFPELVIVLSGYGTTVYLHGETFIKDGITSNTFRTIPDVPVESFQLTLPQGPNHALAANGSLCAPTRIVTRRKRVQIKRHGHTRIVTRKVHKRIAAGLVMPTVFTAQNGMVIHENTHIAVTGCAKHKPHRNHHHKHKHHKHKKK